MHSSYSLADMGASDHTRCRTQPHPHRHTVDFTLSPELQALQQRTRDFIREQVVPLESAAPRDPHGPSETLRRELVDEPGAPVC
jgi:hypothetical protein